MMLKKRFVFFILVLVSCSSSHSRRSAPEETRTSLPPPQTPEHSPSIDTKTLSFLWPLEGKPRIASFFGWRKKGGRKKGERMHEGIDIGGSLGQKVYASADGRVIDVAYVKGYGRTVLVYHGGGWSTLYAHLSKYRTKKGKEVKAGDVLGLVGHSGHAEANHLHFEVRKGADPLDPLLFLPSRELEKYAPKNFVDDSQ